MLFEVLVPIILVVGVFGNLLSFYVFTQPSVKGLSTFRFLAYLSIIDLFYLIIGLPHIMVIVYVDYDFRNYSNMVCSLHTFFTLYLSHLSSNVLAGVGVFRCMTITSLRPVNPNINKNNKNNTYQTNNHHTSLIAERSMRVDSMVRSTTSSAMGPGATKSDFNNKKTVKIVFSDHRKSIFRRVASNFGNADIIVIAIMLIIFLFDFHFLIWMRLSDADDYYDTEESETYLSSNIYNNNNNNNLNNLTDTILNNTNSDIYRVYNQIPIISDKNSNLNNSSNKQIRSKKCYPSTKTQEIYYEFYTKVYHWIDLFLYSYIPFGIMMVCTVLIIYRLIKISKRLKTKSSSSRDKNNKSDSLKLTKVDNTEDKSCPASNGSPDFNSEYKTNNTHTSRLPSICSRNNSLVVRRPRRTLKSDKKRPNQSEIAKRRSKKNSQIYKLLLTLNIFFFVLVTPVVLTNSLGLLKSEDQITFELVYISAYLNHCLNFIFYGLSCKIYRNILLDLFKKKLNMEH